MRPRTEMFWQRRGDQAARMGNWKWINGPQAAGLYDLATDLAEAHDLSQARPDVVSQVKARFEAWRREMQASEPRGPFRDF